MAKEKYKIKPLPFIALGAVLVGIIVTIAVVCGSCNNSKEDASSSGATEDVTAAKITVKIDTNDCTMLLGEAMKVTATVEPEGNAAVIWKSSDESVMEVTQDGIITGKQEGIAALTATVGTTSDAIVITWVSQLAENETGNGNQQGETQVGQHGGQVVTQPGTENSSGSSPTLPSGDKETVSVNPNQPATNPSQGQQPTQSQSQAPSQGQRPTQGQSQTPGQSQQSTQGQSQAPSQGQQPTQGQSQAPSQGQQPTQGQSQAPSQGQKPTQGQTSGQGQQPTQQAKPLLSLELPGVLGELGFKKYISNVYVYEADKKYCGQVVIESNVAIIYIMNRQEAFDEAVLSVLQKLVLSDAATVWNTYCNTASGTTTTFYVGDRRVRIIKAGEGESQIVIYN